MKKCKTENTSYKEESPLQTEALRTLARKKQANGNDFSNRLLRRESPLDIVVKKLCRAHTIALC